MSLFSYIRFRLRPPGKKPPPKNRVDVYFDPEQAAFVHEDSQNNKTRINRAPLVLDTLPEDASVAAPNFLETNITGANNDLRFEQVGTGAAPTILYGSGPSFTPVSVTVVGSAVSVFMGEFGGVSPTTANQVLSAVNGDPSASALIVASLKAGNDGTGAMGDSYSFGPTALSGGTPASEGTPADYLGQIAIVNEEEFYKNVRLTPVKWAGPLT